MLVAGLAAITVGLLRAKAPPVATRENSDRVRIEALIDAVSDAEVSMYDAPTGDGAMGLAVPRGLARGAPPPVFSMLDRAATNGLALRYGEHERRTDQHRNPRWSNDTFRCFVSARAHFRGSVGMLGMPVLSDSAPSESCMRTLLSVRYALVLSARGDFAALFDLRERRRVATLRWPSGATSDPRVVSAALRAVVEGATLDPDAIEVARDGA